MRFELIDVGSEAFPVKRLCQVLEVSPSGYFAWRGRPASPRQREDLVVLAHIRSAFARSNETYGSPRMTRELQDEGLQVHIGSERDLANVNAQDLLAADHVRVRHHDLAIEAAGTQQGGVEHVGPVGGRDDD